MQIVKPLSLGILHRTYRHRGADRLVVAATGFFRLGAAADERFLAEHGQWPLVAPLLPAEQPYDELMPKQCGEVLVAASACAPGGAPVPEMRVRLKAGSVDKTLRVLGEREWLHGLVPSYRITPPQPFTEMPLGYERAYGGPKSRHNPVGRGYTGNRFAAFVGANRGAMPNVEYPDEAVRSNCRKYRPAGFGPLDLRWAPRCDKRGTYDQRWLERDFPGLAADTDWSLFNAAPEDQRIEGFFAGGEPYRLEGMHPQRPVIEGELPRMRARAFVLRKGRAPSEPEEVALALDTIWFFPGRELGLAIYRGQTGLADSDALDIVALMAGYERAADVPRTAARYGEVLALRLDPKTAGLHALNESQLAPERTEAERARRTERRRREQEAALARQQAALDAAMAEFWEKSGLRPEAGYMPPRAEPPLAGTPTPGEIEDCDFDLSEVMQAAENLAEDAKQRGEAQLRTLPASPPAAPPVDAVVQRQAALARAAPAAPEEAETAALRRQVRRIAPEPTMPPEPLLPAVADALGERALAWHRAGVPLAGRDLAGACLRGMDFSGADLSEILLERADLTGARFAGAKLERAVFAGAILDGADFSGAQLAEANFSASRGSGIRFTGAKLERALALEAVWPGAHLERAVLDGLVARKIDLAGAILDGSVAVGAVLLEARAADSRWHGARLERTLLLGAGLERADFSRARLKQSVLLDAVLRESRWEEAQFQGVAAGGKADWRRALLRGARAEASSWRGATLAGADLSGSKLVQCDFGDADLSAADVRGALLARSILTCARLTDCRAQGADFFQAIAHKTDFAGADLRGASLAQAQLFGARFEQAMLEAA